MADGEADEQELVHQQEAEPGQEEKALHPRHPPSVDDTLGVIQCLVQKLEVQSSSLFQRLYFNNNFQKN